jgi:hypothetical protein
VAVGFGGDLVTFSKLITREERKLAGSYVSRLSISSVGGGRFVVAWVFAEDLARVCKLIIREQSSGFLHIRAFLGFRWCGKVGWVGWKNEKKQTGWSGAGR